MAIQIIKRGNAQAQQPQQQTEPANLLTRLGFSGLRGTLDVPTNLFNFANQLIGGDIYGQPEAPSESIRKVAGLTPQQLEPQGNIEKILQGGIEKAPTTLALGGGAPLVGLGFAGSAARNVAEQAGFGPVGQTVAELGTEFGGSAISRGLTPGRLRTKLRPEMKKSYQLAEHEIKPIAAQPAENLAKYVDETLNELPRSGLSRAGRSEVKSELQNLGKDIFNNKIKPSEAWTWKKHFNKLIDGEMSKLDPDYGLVNFYRRAVGNLNGVLQETADKFPKFGEQFKKAEDIFKGLDAPNTIRRVLEEQTELKNIIKKNPLPKIAAILGGYYKGGVPLAVATATLPFTARYAARAYDLFNRSETARNLATKIAYDVGKDNIRSAINSFKRLDHLISKEEKSSKNPKIKIIKRGTIPG